MIRLSAVVLALSILVVGSIEAAAQIPNSARPGRERDLFFDRPNPAVPRIQLQDGRPAPVITPSKSKKRPAKRRTNRNPRSR